MPEIEPISSEAQTESASAIDPRLARVNDIVNIVRCGGTWDVRQAIFDLEPYLDIDEAAAAVMAAMKDTRRRVRYAASLILGGVNLPEAKEILFKGCSDTDEWVSRNCKTALRERNEAEYTSGENDKTGTVVLKNNVSKICTETSDNSNFGW